MALANATRRISRVSGALLVVSMLSSRGGRRGWGVRLATLQTRRIPRRRGVRIRERCRAGAALQWLSDSPRLPPAMSAAKPRIACLPNGPYYLLQEEKPSPVANLVRHDGSACAT